MVAVGALAGCGGSSRAGSGDAAQTPPPAAAPFASAGSVQPAPTPSAASDSIDAIGSIARDPASHGLVLGSGAGLFRAAPQGGLAERVVGELRTPKGSGPVSSNLVVSSPGAGELLASGHPESPGSPLPQNLGLIRSTDGGATWKPVSGLGRDDFHILQAAGDRVVAVGADGSAIRISTDAGRSFGVRRTPPSPPVDVAFDPGRPERMVVTTEEGLYTSADQGKRWRPRDTVAGAQLAWAASGDLYRADPGGVVRVSRDGGQTWRKRGSVRQPVTELAVDARGALYASVADGKVLRSTDGGATWDPFIIVK
jgi:photosystem II stability/assembly factor-like uncharacterized protein